MIEGKSTFNDCCNHGKVEYPPVPEFNGIMKDMFNKVHSKHLNFMEYIRNYNSALACASLRGDIQVIPGRGPYILRFLGIPMMQVGPLYPMKNNPSYAQLYIVDTKEACTRRNINKANEQCDNELMDLLSQWMEDNNPYAVRFRSMRNKLDEENEAAQDEGRAIQDLQLFFMKKGTGLAEKVYSLPSADENAAVCAPTDEGEFQEASYVSFPKHGGLKYLCVTDPTRYGMVFHVLFPKGVRIKEFGHPDLLITFTSNPRWDEIISIIGDDSPANHPDIVSKIFIIKLQELLDDIVKHHILEDKLNTTNKIDNIISAEIPSVEQDSELHNAVLRHMIHRECYEGSECWENNECKKGFPKHFCEFTQLADKGYPFYQRKDNSVEATEGKYQNNSWVVPYN
ncbi:MAG: putative ATP-dependent DNA helicase pif1 [Streblomastix strix]|uniref:Putative ATP-dependent DNA helicase pif1 n=1 Tax=Streblomastix strix TaxID=222440 RepID=A0A5J4WNF7_9EUKA|nr:MAG: putative ATP-dependent DNA helicase pif1 [Streblomastix strix]